MKITRWHLQAILLAQLVLSTFELQGDPTLTTLAPIGSNYGLVQANDGNFYGTTTGGNEINTFGTIFKVTQAGVVTTVATFDGTNGAYPQTGLIRGSDGNLYGTTTNGYDANGGGVSGSFFRITPAGALIVLLRTNNLSQPTSFYGITQANDGNFYGIDYYGHFYSLSTSGTLTLIPLTGLSNATPYGNLIQGRDGNFYAMAAGGANNDGAVVRITPTGTITTLASFNGLNGSYVADNNLGYGDMVQGKDGNFYGTTEFGGTGYNGTQSTGAGTLFKLTPQGTLTTLVSFDGVNGSYPTGSLIQGSDGNLYGTTFRGGMGPPDAPSFAFGTVFESSLSGSLTTLATFDDTNGGFPKSGVVQGQDGNFYGTTSDDATVFELSASNKFAMRMTSSVTNGTSSDKVDNSLIPTPNPNALARQPTVSTGLVADGVTPLVLEFDAPTGITKATKYTINFDNFISGSASVPLASHLYVLNNGTWQSGNKLSISPNQPAFAYLSGLLPEQIIPASNGVVTVGVSLTPSGSNTASPTGTLELARPPIVLVHGYAADQNSWSIAFINQLQVGLPAGFVVPITYDPLTSSTNKSGSLRYEAQLLDQTLFSTADSLKGNAAPSFPGWAYTRYDVVAHSQGGVLARMLCTVNSAAPNSDSTPFGTAAYRNGNNFYRGRFRRVVTIGSPQNGSRFLHYGLQLHDSSGFFLNAIYLGGIMSGYFQPKFDPFGVQIAGNTMHQIKGINDPSFSVDPNANFNCVSAEVNSGNVPEKPNANVAYLLTALCDPVSPTANYTVGQIVLGGNNGSPSYPVPDVAHGNGSDGVVDRLSQEGGVGSKVTRYTNHNVSHADKPGLFGIFTSGQSETTDSALAGTIAGLLQQPNSAGSFGKFVMPKPYVPNGSQQKEIDDVVPAITEGDVLIALGAGALEQKASVPASVKADASSSYSFSLTPLANESLQGDVTWYAEVYAQGGITTSGITVQPDPTDSTQVSVAVDSSVVGEVVLYASYQATDGRLIVAKPIKVASIAPAVAQTGISLPTPGQLTSGETLDLDLNNVYSDGTTQPVFLGTTPTAQFGSSNYNVLAVDAYGKVTGVSPGQATVTASYAGYTAQTTLTVVPAGLPPQITSSNTATASVGATFSYQIAALQNPNNFSAAIGLPPGLNINSSTGAIYGVPTTAGDYAVELTATNAISSDTQSLTIAVAQGAQTIDFPTIPPQVNGEGNLNLSALASSGLPLTFTVVSGPATISGDVLTFTGAGTVVVSATQAGNGNYYAAKTVTETIKVGAATTKTAQTISFGVIAIQTAGSAIPLGATASSNLPVSYVVAGPAKLMGTTLSLTGAGVVSVTATQSGNATYAEAASVTQVFDVVKEVQVIAFAASANATYGQAPLKLVATATSFLPVTFKVDSGPAKVVGGTLTITGAGTVVVEADQAGNAIYAAAPSTLETITVAPASQAITFPAIANKVLGAAPFVVTATASSKLPVTFSVVSGPATISGSKLTLTGGGVVTLQASQAGNANYAPATSVSRSFTVTPKT